MMKKLFLAALLFLAAPLHAEQDWKAFAQLPIVEQPQISPDGRLIAMLYNTVDGPTVAVAPFGSLDFMVVAKLKKSRDRLDFIRWSGNQFIIIGASAPEYLSGTYFRKRRLYAVNLNDNSSRQLTSRRFESTLLYPYQSFDLVSALKEDPEHVLVATYDERDRDYAVYKVNLATSDFVKVQRNGEEIKTWLADQDGVIRVGVGVEKDDKEFKKHIWYRSEAGAELKNIHTQVIGKDNTFQIIGIKDGSNVYVISDRVSGYESLWLYNVENGEFLENLFEADGYDISDGLWDAQNNLIGIEYYDDFYRTHYFDPADGGQEKMVAGLLKGKEVTIASKSADKTRLLALASSDDSVPVYFWFDIAAQKGGVWISKYPHLAKKQFAPVENITFEASDGMRITGYLTLPPGVESPPLVVMPHGGPHARDYKYFDPLVQYIVSLGYAVLQVNFRGSSGFGSAFETAGYFEYGKRMQEDVYDAMDWLAGTGRVDKTRTCSLGLSYGGYWALTAAFQKPDRFDCVVSISGISDLEDMVNKRERRDFYFGNIVDDSDEDKLKNEIAALADVSAINHIEKIKAPILLIHGDNDTRVPFRQSSDFYEKAKKSKDIRYIEIKDGTHFFDDTEAKQTLYKEIGGFLEKHL